MSVSSCVWRPNTYSDFLFEIESLFDLEFTSSRLDHLVSEPWEPACPGLPSAGCKSTCMPGLFYMGSGD